MSDKNYPVEMIQLYQDSIRLHEEELVEMAKKLVKEFETEAVGQIGEMKNFSLCAFGASGKLSLSIGKRLIEIEW